MSSSMKSICIHCGVEIRPYGKNAFGKPIWYHPVVSKHPPGYCIEPRRLHEPPAGVLGHVPHPPKPPPRIKKEYER